MTRLAAVIGDPVKHSLSPRMHTAALKHLKIDAKYFAWQIPSHRLAQIKNRLTDPDFVGFNVTLPHKQAVHKYCQKITPLAKRVGAVNTVYRTSRGWLGDNTDVPGFLKALKQLASVRSDQKAVVFGAGGASLAVITALIEANMKKIYLCNRTLSKAKQVQKKLKSSKIEVIPYQPVKIQEAMQQSKWIVNTTSLGLGHQKNNSPVPRAEYFNAKHCVVDLVYLKKGKTFFVKQALKKTSKVQNGLPMLLYQGVLSFEKIFGRKAPVSIMKKSLGL